MSAQMNGNTKEKRWSLRRLKGRLRCGKKKNDTEVQTQVQEEEKPAERPPKKMPVFFLDEAHKLYVQSVFWYGRWLTITTFVGRL